MSYDGYYPDPPARGLPVRERGRHPWSLLLYEWAVGAHVPDGPREELGLRVEVDSASIAGLGEVAEPRVSLLHREGGGVAVGLGPPRACFGVLVRLGESVVL